MSNEKEETYFNKFSETAEASMCSSTYRQSAFVRAYISTRNFPGRWYVRCIYDGSNFYEPVSDLSQKPGLRGKWERFPGRSPQEPDAWVCSRSSQNCQFFAQRSLHSQNNSKSSSEEKFTEEQNQISYKNK